MINIDKDDKLVSIKVYEPKQKRYKYIAETKEYFDKINGNSYWSCRVEDIEKDVVYVFPFQYGYGDQSEYTVRKALNITNGLGEKPVYIKFIKHEKCSMKSVKEWGTESEETYYADKGYYYLD
tara:strand:- start:7 stop:375 length:369 start_codon:yes stop_codon:yes gene_type:complete